MTDFIEFPKIARYSREVIVTEKIDGSNAQIFIDPFENPTYDGWDQRPDGEAWYHEFSGSTFAKYAGVVWKLQAGSRSRYVWRGDDNFGFARWCEANAAELVKLGPGRHYGEWWGSGIQRGYGLLKGEKRFSLFNVSRWSDDATRHACCHVVPVICRNDSLDILNVRAIMENLADNGSHAAPGFMKPEGIVIFHAQGNVAFKKTFEKDDAGKGREPVVSELTHAA